MVLSMRKTSGSIVIDNERKLNFFVHLLFLVLTFEGLLFMTSIRSAMESSPNGMKSHMLYKNNNVSHYVHFIVREIP